MDAKKCDRCGSYFDYSPVTKNFIAFGHKDIVVGRNLPTKDICPDCMVSFTKWFENPDDERVNNLGGILNENWRFGCSLRPI